MGYQVMGGLGGPSARSNSTTTTVTTTTTNNTGNARAIAAASGGKSNRTPPNCARCRNHGIKVPLVAHKRYCPNKNCECRDCILTKDRQRVMALQTALRRAQAQDELRAKRLKENEERVAMGKSPFSSPSLPPSTGGSCIDVEMSSEKEETLVEPPPMIVEAPPVLVTNNEWSGWPRSAGISTTGYSFMPIDQVITFL